MKKILALLLVITMVVSLSACSDKSSSNIPSNGSQINSSNSSEPSKPEVVPDIDLVELANELIEKFPPNEGTELKIKTDDINEIFNIHPDPVWHVDLSLIDEYVRVYNHEAENYYEFILIKVNDFQNMSGQIKADFSNNLRNVDRFLPDISNKYMTDNNMNIDVLIAYGEYRKSIEYAESDIPDKSDYLYYFITPQGNEMAEYFRSAIEK